jgi:hypothetical protein
MEAIPSKLNNKICTRKKIESAAIGVSKAKRKESEGKRGTEGTDLP